MPVSTNIQIKDGYICIVSAGIMLNGYEAQEYGERIYKVACECDVTRILLDERQMIDEEDAMDAYEFSESDTMSQMAIEGFRVALISSPENLEINRTWETVMQNRSFNLRVFTDKNEATRWLTS